MKNKKQILEIFGQLVDLQYYHKAENPKKIVSDIIELVKKVYNVDGTPPPK